MIRRWDYVQGGIFAGWDSQRVSSPKANWARNWSRYWRYLAINHQPCQKAIEKEPRAQLWVSTSRPTNAFVWSRIWMYLACFEQVQPSDTQVCWIELLQNGGNLESKVILEDLQKIKIDKIFKTRQNKKLWISISQNYWREFCRVISSSPTMISKNGNLTAHRPRTVCCFNPPVIAWSTSLPTKHAGHAWERMQS